jgi:hypothetical protein
MSHIPFVFSSLCIRMTSFSMLLPVFPASDISAARRICMVHDTIPRHAHDQDRRFRWPHVKSSRQVKCIMNSTEFGDVRYKPNGYFEWGRVYQGQCFIFVALVLV